MEDVLKLSEINVFAYLAPHPLDEDSYIEEDWLTVLPGYLNVEDEEYGIKPIFRADNIDLYTKYEKFTEEQFRKSFINLYPLLQEFKIETVQVAIDYLGLISTNDSLANYLYERSHPAKGRYVFCINYNLLDEYSKILLEGQKLRFKSQIVWEHALIHLLDHWELLKASVYAESKIFRENLKYYILKFREEGIAELYHLLHGEFSKITSIEQAKKEYKNNFLQIINKFKSQNLSVNTIRNDIYNRNIFYDVGPWLILDILKTFRGNWYKDLIIKCLSYINKKKPVPKETILEVINIALNINIELFLEYIENNVD